MWFYQYRLSETFHVRIFVSGIKTHTTQEGFFTF